MWGNWFACMIQKNVAGVFSSINGLKGKPFVLHDSWSFTSNLSKEDKEKISVALINVINSCESLNHADYMGIVLYAPSFQVY